MFLHSALLKGLRRKCIERLGIAWCTINSLIGIYCTQTLLTYPERLVQQNSTAAEVDRSYVRFFFFPLRRTTAAAAAAAAASHADQPRNDFL